MPNPTDRLNAALAGRYEIERPLGEGGMATVYVARDLKHNRQVALKVLKPELAAVVGGERFLAEIETTANLQHPHILPLFDSGAAEGFLFYVMPYVEGETLAGRIEREKQLPVDEAVRIVVAVANALQAAHGAGVIHRDIKPGNILLSRGEPLVADFGIALAVGAAGGSRLTETGLSVGTPHYMSPEQATGDQHVGAASDVYSLACVLYEMLVGEPPYLGNTAQAVLGKIIQGQPVSASATRKSVPANVDAAIRRALEKLPADRFARAEEFARALGDPTFRYGGDAAGTVRTSSGPAWLRWAHGALTLLLAGAAAWALTRPEAPRQIMKFKMDADVDGILAAPMSLAMSPDGSFIVHPTTPVAGGGSLAGGLALQRLDGLPPTPVTVGESAFQPTISPDGTEMAFVSAGDGRLNVIPVTGGVSRQVADSVACCAHWGNDGYIYFVGGGDFGIARVLASGTGELERVLTGPEVPSAGAGFPRLSRSGEVLFVVTGFFSTATATLDAIRLADGTRTVLTQGVASPPHHTESGHLLFVDVQGRLVAARFDESTLGLDESRITLAEGLLLAPMASFAVSESGAIVYASGAAEAGEVQPVWVDRQGAVEVIHSEWRFGFASLATNRGVSLSPDGSRVAASVFRPDGTADIYIKELPRGPFSRFTATVAEETRPRWTPDGASLTYLQNEGAGYRGYRVRADLATTDATPITEVGVFEVEVTPGEQWVASRQIGPTSMDLSAVPLNGGTGPIDLTTAFTERAIAVSPNGRWIAFESNDNGRAEVYVRSFPELSRSKRQISPSGGSEPRWGRNGDELFYIDAQRRMVSVAVRGGEELVLGEQTPLFTVPADVLTALSGEFYALYDVDVDDRRFLMLRGAPGVARVELVLMLNAFELLKGS